MRPPLSVAAREAPAQQETRAPLLVRLAPDPDPTPDFSDPDRATKLAALLPKIEAKVDEIFARDAPPSLAVAMIVDGRPVFQRFLGARDRETKAPVSYTHLDVYKRQP